MIFKFAFRNLIRLPWRTVLYFFMIFFIIVSITASVLIWHACLNAESTLEENYVFVASLVPKKKNGLLLSDLSYCLTDTEVLAYNVTMSEREGCIPFGENMKKLPSKESTESPEKILFDGRGCAVAAVENLSLEHAFFSGKCRIREGTGLSAEGYSGNVPEIVIPWWLAERYGLAVGDTVVRYYNALYLIGQTTHIFLNCEIVGIYECTETVKNEMQYPAYVPLAIGERDYKKLPNGARDALNIQRADFLLGGRDGFEDFVRTVEKNGMDFKNGELIFNNSVYDALSVELENICAIALTVAGIVLTVGVCVLVFFTVYLYHSREKERTLLAYLGMPKGKINGMIALEHILVFTVAVGIGIGAGFGVAERICQSVNESVLEKASLSETITSGEDELETTEPMEYPVKIGISVFETASEGMDMEINYRKTVGENEIGVSSCTYYTVGDSATDILTSALEPFSVVGISDIDVAATSIRREALPQIPNDSPSLIYGFVSKDSPYAAEIAENGRKVLFIAGDGKNSYVSMSGSSLEESTMIGTAMLILVGTYGENPYCSGSDILVGLADYHRLYSHFSITSGGYYIERIGAVYPREEKR